MGDVWSEAKAERARAHRLHGRTSMEEAPADDPTGHRLRVLLEEVGEVAKEFNDARNEERPLDMGRLRKELVQVCAMAGAWADVIPKPTKVNIESMEVWSPRGELVYRRGYADRPDFGTWEDVMRGAAP
jgi:hypothetical protein